MKLDVQLPPIFTHGNCAVLDGDAFQELNIQPRTVGNPWFSTKLSGMRERVLRLRLDDVIYDFREARKQVVYTTWYNLPIRPITPKRVVSLQLIRAQRELTLIVCDEATDKLIGVINDQIHWDLDGLDVKFQMVP